MFGRQVLQHHDFSNNIFLRLISKLICLIYFFLSKDKEEFLEQKKIRLKLYSFVSSDHGSTIWTFSKLNFTLKF